MLYNLSLKRSLKGTTNLNDSNDRIQFKTAKSSAKIKLKDQYPYPHKGNKLPG